MNAHIEKPHRVLITGTGRTGTTFLVWLLTELGLDTKRKVAEVRAIVNSPIRAGLEGDLNPTIDYNAYITKNPFFCTQIRNILKWGYIIDHVYIPIRDMHKAAASRIRLGKLWGVKKNVEQVIKLYELFGQLVSDLILLDIPHTFIKFPEFVLDWEYCYKKLEFLVKDIEKEHFKKIFKTVSKPELITIK